MTENANPNYRPGIAGDLDRAVSWIRGYLRSRTTSDWGFFACGILIGHFLF